MRESEINRTSTNSRVLSFRAHMIAFLEARRAGLLAWDHIGRNVVAGIIVGIVALPLALAFAIASGAKPEQGLYTAIVAGIATSLLGGTRVQISGPTGAFVAVLAGITAQYGIGGLQVATLMAGCMLLVMGFAQLGSVIKFIPSPVIAGFTTGIAVIIWTGQWKDFFGLHPAASGTHFHEKTWALIQSFASLDVPTTAIAILTLLAIAIGTAFGGIPRSLPSLGVPDISASVVIQLIGPAFAIAMLGAIESLLTAVVSDGMVGTRHDSNQELIGQGAANLLAPLFGGFAATGAIARTATNIRNGATSPVAGVVHSLFLVLVIVALAPFASEVPLCALAAILFFVSWNMADLPHVTRLLRRSPRADKLLLITTFCLTVFFDLVVAVNAGVVLAALLFMRRMALTVNVREEDPDGMDDVTLPPNVLVYRIEGPFFFGAAEKLERTLERTQLDIRTIVIRLGRVPFIDATGLQTLTEIIERFHKRNVAVVLCGIHSGVVDDLKGAGVFDLVGEENVCRNLMQVAQRVRSIG